MMGYIPSYILAISIYPAEPNQKLVSFYKNASRS
jgi:hypothetical protein